MAKIIKFITGHGWNFQLSSNTLREDFTAKVFAEGEECFASGKTAEDALNYAAAKLYRKIGGW